MAASLRRPAALALLACALLGASGCSTPGPTHAYVASRAQDPIFDLPPDNAASVALSSHLDGSHELYGLAYDPFTDHLYLRIEPGDFISVIDRPAKKIKRRVYIPELTPGRGDLTIRSRDRHLFFAHPTRAALLETTLFGVAVRTVALEGLTGPPSGVAYDQSRDQFFILHAGSPASVGTHALDGRLLASFILDRPVRSGSLAYDYSAAELYAPLLNEPGVGVFNLQGRLQRTLASPAAHPPQFIDVGQRSLFRLF